jgi:hypothetical protein
VEGVFSEVSVSATRYLLGQLDAAVRSHRGGRVPHHFPQVALGISEETVAPGAALFPEVTTRCIAVSAFAVRRTSTKKKVGMTLQRWRLR